MIFQSRLAAGQILGGRYIIIRLIGSGGMSHVYLAEDLRLKGKRWAVKESLQMEGNYGDIQSEAELLLSLNHPLLPGVADFFAPDEAGYCYLVMDYIEGESLAQYMARHHKAIEGVRIVSYAKQLLEVMEYLHGHHPPVIYRDLKPGNIMLTGPEELRLIDFGIARAYRNGADEDTEKLGTVGFAAPEQYGGGQTQPASDLYGLGALMLYMASGGQYSRWQPRMENSLRGAVPDALIPVIRRLLRYHPEERYQSAGEVMGVLEAIEASMNKQALRNRGETLVKCSETVIIALLGTASGLGTTHTSLAVSHALSHAGSTAWVDFSPESQVFERYWNLLDQSPVSGPFSSGRSSCLDWKGLHFWKRPPQGNLQQLLENSAYSYIVLDLGCATDHGQLEMFANSDVPVLIASGADWRLEDILLWLQRSGQRPQPKWRIGLPFAEDAAAALLESGLGLEIGQVCSLPVQQNPFQQKGKLSAVIEGMLANFTKAQKQAKRKGIFQKKA